MTPEETAAAIKALHHAREQSEGNKMKFRPQRGGLAEAMSEAVELRSYPEFLAHIRGLVEKPVEGHDLSIEPYVDEPDDRIGWAQTWIVELKGWGPVGYTDGPGFVTPEETAAAIKALHHAREQSRTALKPWPTIEEEVQIVLEAAERVRKSKLED